MLSAQSAWAATATDPDDVEGGLDVARSRVAIRETDPGIFRLRLTVWTYDEFDLSGGVGSFYWQLDTKGTGRPDYEVFVFGDPKAEPAAPVFCLVKSMRTRFQAYVDVRQGDKRVTCSIPRRFVRIDDGIRWRLAGRMQGVIDRAPDTGWYG